MASWLENHLFFFIGDTSSNGFFSVKIPEVFCFCPRLAPIDYRVVKGGGFQGEGVP